jgi:predicted ATPase
VNLDALALPDTVQGVITSRIDRLAPPQQLTLKVASAIGREFVFRILRDIHPVETDKPQLPTYLDTLERLQLTQRELEPELMYLFKHTITQDVAYNLMLFAQRRELHRVIGEWYEREYADRLPQVYPLLAHHWSRAAEGQGQLTERALVTKAVDYLTKAGEQASQISAFREAIAAYERALALAPPIATRNGGNQGGGTRASLLVRLGNTYEAMGDFPAATNRLQEALALARRAGEVKIAAESLSGLCWVATRQGKAAEARTLGEEALTLAREAGDKATMALALRRLGVVVVSKSDPTAAIRYYEDSLASTARLATRRASLSA